MNLVPILAGTSAIYCIKLLGTHSQQNELPRYDTYYHDISNFRSILKNLKGYMDFLGIDLHSNCFTCCLITVEGKKNKISHQLEPDSSSSNC
jgi:hypothetical protein